MPRKHSAANEYPDTWYKPPVTPICPLCQREIPAAQSDEHHLVPRLKGGKITTALHRICHRQIHALLSESELAQRYNTVEALLTMPEIQTFVRWVRRKPNDFCDSAKKSGRLR
jgi:hypothetical protein